MSEADMDSEEPKGPAPASLWLDRIKDYQTAFQKWADQCRNLDNLYSRKDRSDAADREYAIFWANIEVLKPAVYARPPVPVVAPRFKDNNEVALSASEILERSCVVNFEQQDLNGLMQAVRDDFLMYARGTGWARFAMVEGKQAVPYDHVTDLLPVRITQRELFVYAADLRCVARHELASEASLASCVDQRD